MAKNIIAVLFVLVLVAGTAALLYSRSNSDSTTPMPTSSTSENSGQVRTLEGGLQIQDIVLGTGDEAKAGMNIAVHYTGTLADGTKFDSSLDRGQPFQFTLGQGMVIRGWDVGVAGMRVGGKRKLIIPPAMAYGDRGAGGVIPPNSTLTFIVELLAVRSGN
jgi:FKBP-type peptidyl-prolyl cis-trans isomerase FkpA